MDTCLLNTALAEENHEDKKIALKQLKKFDCRDSVNLDNELVKPKTSIIKGSLGVLKRNLVAEKSSALAA